MIVNSKSMMNYAAAAKFEFLNTTHVEDEDDESDDESASQQLDSNNLYLTVDLSADIVNKLKSLSTSELEQMKQIGILSVQFDNENRRVSIPSDRPARSSIDINARRDLDQHRAATAALLTGSLNSTLSQQNETAKKRSRKTISELTSPTILHECRDEAVLIDGNKKLARNKRNSKEMEPLVIQHSFPTSGSLSQPHSASSSSYVLTSMIVDQSPNASNSSAYHSASAQLSSQFNYMKQFTMPSPMLSNILNSNEAAISAGGGLLVVPNDKLMGLDEYKNIYQMRQELASQVTGGDGVAVKTEEDKSGGQVVKKARRGPNTSDPNKPKQKRNRQPKAETIQAMGKSTETGSATASSQPQLIRNMINSNSTPLSSAQKDLAVAGSANSSQSHS
jgi:hypothetical protein